MNHINVLNYQTELMSSNSVSDSQKVSNQTQSEFKTIQDDGGDKIQAL